MSFLRRTEYISSEVVRQKIDKGVTKKTVHKVIDPEAQLRSVEDTFEAANTPLESVVHPRNKSLKPVESFALLPDFKQLDLTYLSVKMVNSASLSHFKQKIPKQSLSNSLFKPMSLENDEWMSFFTPTEQDATSLKRKLDNINDDSTIEDDSNVYKYNHIRDYETDLIQNHTQFEDVAINFDAKDEDSHIDDAPSTAWYVSVAGRTNLKRRRVDEAQKYLVAEQNVAGVELSLRELTAQESISRDNIRSNFDSVSYMATESLGDE